MQENFSMLEQMIEFFHPCQYIWVATAITNMHIKNGLPQLWYKETHIFLKLHFSSWFYTFLDFTLILDGPSKNVELRFYCSKYSKLKLLFDKHSN